MTNKGLSNIAVKMITININGKYANVKYVVLSKKASYT